MITAPTTGAQELVPMYCPALAWQGARPWWANVDRVWEFEELGKGPIMIIETPGVFVEELSSDSESEKSEAESWVDIGKPASSTSSDWSFVCVVLRWRRRRNSDNSQSPFTVVD